MNLKNLIRTSTLNMTREQWLDFRQPLTHVSNFLTKWVYTELQDHNKNWNDGVEDPYIFLKYVFESDEWKEFIFPTVGASEIASIVGLSPYKSVIELFYEKVGLKEPYKEMNNAMYWGTVLEEVIANQWQYWEGSQESLLTNAAMKRVIRRCRRINAYIQNTQWPWIFASLDRVINKGEHEKESCLECKTISGYAAGMWENGIPPYHVAQLQTQLFVGNFEDGEIAIFQDGRDFNVYPFDLHPGICERLQRESKIFFDRVKSGIEQFLLFKYAPTPEIGEQHMAAIDRLSPEPDGSTAYETFLSDRYKNDSGYEKYGTEVDLHLAKAYDYYRSQIKVMEDHQRECSNKLLKSIEDAAVLSFGEEGKVTWKANKKGSRVFLVKVKAGENFQPDPEILNCAEKSLELG